MAEIIQATAGARKTRYLIEQQTGGAVCAAGRRVCCRCYGEDVCCQGQPSTWSWRRLRLLKIDWDSRIVGCPIDAVNRSTKALEIPRSGF